ncbi:Hypothetical protein I595_3603 [Croceitalea dokdonensis DOKDO 023]|uniref:DUF3667 domain-containing protein n=1 Tax=Croceitalea dokdonensis DOKDO 023 TaxID=1300341 RepID=A0A0P7AML0_9FLAO|nr:Hypothetical protein I595_3603 [Croceitalea dokdonensis DOKDO 023]
MDKSDKYCPNCSQANSTKKLTLKDFFDEFLSSLVNYDSKLLNTLFTMLRKPGTITKDYINGKRMSYTNPFRFLLSLAFIYLLLVGYNSSLNSLDQLKIEENLQDEFTVNLSMEKVLEQDSITSGGQLKKVFFDLDSLRAEDPKLLKGVPNLDSIQQLIDLNAKETQRMDSLMLANPTAYFQELEQSQDDFMLFSKMKFFYRSIKKDSIASFDDAVTNYGITDNWSNRKIFNASQSLLRVVQQPAAWLNDTIAKLPFVVFLFLPLFTVFLFVVYIRKKYTYTDHLIFSFHNQSLLFILLILSFTVDAIFKWSTTGLFLLLFAVYLFKAMRRFYGQGYLKTLIKYVFLNIVFMFLAVLTTVLLFTGSIITY